MNVNYATTGGRRKNRQHSPMEVQTADDTDFVFDESNDFKFIHGEQKEDQRKCAWFAGSWVLTALGAMLSFASANLLINELSPLGFDAISYYNTGGLVFCLLYMVTRCGCYKPQKLSRSSITSQDMLHLGIAEYREYLFYRRNGEFDIRIVVLIAMASFLTCAMFLSVSFTYALAG